MTAPNYSEAELDAAIAALEDPDRFREAEAMVGVAAPKLARVLAQALEAGGWFAESHEDAAATVASTQDPEERLTALRTLLAEETRVGMLVGVAVGWALADELKSRDEENPS
jgi:aspartate/methionine/tyrosine aminotransferase